MTDHCRLTNGVLCCPDGLRRDLDLVIDEGRIKLEPTARSVADDTTAVDLAGSYVLPGFIEIHTHGAGLFEFTMGRYDPDRGEFDSSQQLYADELARYLKLRARTGVTSMYPGTWAAPVERQLFCFRQLKRYIDSPGNGRDGAFVLGGLLEGTFINPDMSGAQNPKFVFQPDPELFDRLNETGIIRLANVVPDAGEDACKLIRHLTDRGISVGAGHTNATADQFKQAIDAGLKYCIHFLNGPIGGSYKAFNGGGGIEAVLREDIHAELIMDGIHVAPAYVRDVLARKGLQRVMAVTDAMFASQSDRVKEFAISGIRGKLDDTGRYVYIVGSEPITLFSSILTMDTAFANLLSWLTVESEGIWRRHEALDFDQAVLAASRCCSSNIVEMLRRRGGDQLNSGELTDGKWADLTIADIVGEPGRYRLDVKQTLVRGRKVCRGQHRDRT